MLIEVTQQQLIEMIELSNFHINGQPMKVLSVHRKPDSKDFYFFLADKPQADEMPEVKR